MEEGERGTMRARKREDRESKGDRERERGES